MYKHVKVIHEGEKDFKCEKCFKTFGMKENLKKHSIIHVDGAQDFKCDKCSRHFGLKSYLNPKHSEVFTP